MLGCFPWVLGVVSYWLLWKIFGLLREDCKEFGLASQRAGNKLAHRLDMYALRHKPGSVEAWTTDIHESVFIYLEVGVSDLAHRTRILWGLFEDSHVMGKAILKKLTQVISDHTHRHGIPVRSHEMAGDHIVDVAVLWEVVKHTLQGLVVDKLEKNVEDLIHKMNEELKETDRVLI